MVEQSGSLEEAKQKGPSQHNILPYTMSLSPYIQNVDRERKGFPVPRNLTCPALAHQEITKITCKTRAGGRERGYYVGPESTWVPEPYPGSPGSLSMPFVNHTRIFGIPDGKALPMLIAVRGRSLPAYLCLPACLCAFHTVWPPRTRSP